MKRHNSSPILLVACLLAAFSVFPPSAAHAGAPGALLSEPPVVATAEQRIELAADLDAIFGDPAFASSFFGVVVQSLDSGDVWYTRDADKLLMPASNQKIPTTAVALRVLGPDFTYTTSVHAGGDIVDGVLQGNLLVWGNGDPTLYTRFFSDPREVFRGWAELLKEQGINRIEGDIVGDASAWDDTRVGYGWPVDNLTWWYGAEVGPLLINENYVDLMIHPPAEPALEARIVPNLPSSYYTIVNRLAVEMDGRNDVEITRDLGTNTIVVSGRVVAGTDAFELSPAITNPTLFYTTVLKEVLVEAGIEVTGQAREMLTLPRGATPTRQLPELIVHNSPTYDKIATVLMKRSQNLYAEAAVRTVAWKETGFGSFRAGRTIVNRELATMGIEPGTYAFMDGSGLTRYNLISARQIANILVAMKHNEDLAELWLEVMPVMGVDGTLSRRLRDTPAQGNVRAKTGTISNVRALSGYLTTESGEELVFSIIANNQLQGSGAVDRVVDQALLRLVEFSPVAED